MTEYLPNYLHTFRKRNGYSQAELALLLGEQPAKAISRYERAVREPDLRTVIAFEVVFDESAAKLSAGIYEEVELAVILQARTLCERIEVQDHSAFADRKLSALRRIMSRGKSARAK